MNGSSPGPQVTALLAPTNTGKTHRAIERMLEYESGIIGLPLRLLAREVYDRLCRRVGPGLVALVTGEEKLIPAGTRYWVCTVEAMPTGLPVDFIAVDEIQLAAHRERGHVFTQRLLQARGRKETYFLGSPTIRGPLRELVPDADVLTPPRLSELRSVGAHKLGGLPPRSAIVAFTAAEVYRLASLLRERHGGAAVVLGALSPRARNAQVAMYQSGEVAYLVATDAIGMGLNLSVDHVAFASLRKFDGREHRLLDPAELAQIAGRAGRHLNAGTFGTLLPQSPLPQHVAEQLERHRLPALPALYYRNHDLAFTTVADLLATLRAPPPPGPLRSVPVATDQQVLEFLATRSSIQALANGPERVALLWEVCQVPDFGGHLAHHHAQLLEELYVQLCGPSGRLTEEYLERQLQRLTPQDRQIDELTHRLELVRTWAYVANHEHWVPNPAHWQAEARRREDQLSDALHDALVAQFVRQRRPQMGVMEKGNPFARLAELRQQLAPTDEVETALGLQLPMEELLGAPASDFTLSTQGVVLHRGIPVATLRRGASLLRPELRPAPLANRSPQDQKLWHRRLLQVVEEQRALLFGPLLQWSEGETPALRGLAYHLLEGLGSAPADSVADLVRGLTEPELHALRRHGLKLGRHRVYFEPMMRSPRLELRLGWVRAFDPSLPELDLQQPLLPLSAIPRALALPLGYVPLPGAWVREDHHDAVTQLLQTGSSLTDLLPRIASRLHLKVKALLPLLPGWPEARHLLAATKGEAPTPKPRKRPTADLVPSQPDTAVAVGPAPGPARKRRRRRRRAPQASNAP